MSKQLDGKDFDIPVYSHCMLCLFFQGNKPGHRQCEAFTEIPMAIWTGKDDHTEGYPGDHGIHFEPKGK